MAKLRFQFNAEKFVNAVAFLAHACRNSTKQTICKQLYYADKEHLVRFGRPIIGDVYYKLPHGPCPTRGLDILGGHAVESALLEKHVSIIGHEVHSRKLANRRVFSKSDLEILEWVVEKYGAMTAAELRKRTHQESPWKDSSDNMPIDYALFFAQHPEAADIKELAASEQEARDLLRPYGVPR